ncbi:MULTISPECIES: hypothetical protein [Soonwooa]|uniref:Transcription elongation factor, GreA/GreB, C-term n=1 Tax=Soonwooa buanensis TaxID=619805 RepID=A0A1T5FP39_9FLAO|nr:MULTISPECIES: hypothetical protein [Soonwooa]SKB97939.1 hypothetical protein SAMN05660477_02180 [Soonwooa buanensis]
MQKIGYEKSELRSFVMQLLSDKIKKLENFIDFTIEASRDIKKTPKYDSIREEAQEEIYQLQKQLAGFYDMQKSMAKVVNSESEKVRLGALVITNKARFYISISLGEFFYDGDRFYAISEESPLAQKMLGLTVGSEFTLNKIHQKIVEII